MQRTRLNRLVETTTGTLARSLQNPWRRISVLIISLLAGVFLGTVIPTTAGQAAEWDIIGAAALITFTETVSWYVYRRSANISPRPLLTDLLNALKLGLTYSLFVEAFKLGS